MNVLDVLQNNQSYLEDFMTRNTYNSNALEGSTMTRNETYALMFDSNHCAINANAKDIHQVINYKRALANMMDRIAKKEPLTVEYLRDINAIINENILFGGAYREDPAQVSGSSKTFPSPDEIERYLEQMVENYNQLIEDGFTMKDVAEMHLNFENIHPFSDGNGRTGRILVDSMLLSGNQVPIVIPLDMRNDYLKMLETNNVKQLAKVFEQLQEDEVERMNNFIMLEEQ